MRPTRFGVVFGALALGGIAHADVNMIQKITTRTDGGKTIITLHGSATPSFTAYRLERPERVVVDLADGRWTQALSDAGPVDVDSAAVGQMAAVSFGNHGVSTARLMVNLKHAATYDVAAKGADVVITLLSDAEIAVEGQKQDLNALRSELANAQGRADAVRKEAEVARAQAAEAQQELKQLATERKEQKEQLQRMTQAQRDQLERQTAELRALRVVAESVATRRSEEAQLLALTHAEALKAAEQKEARLEDVNRMSMQKQAAASELDKTKRELDQARAELKTLVAEQAIERSRAESAKAAAKRVVAARQQAEMEKASMAALASGSKEKIAAAEAEMRRLALQRLKESAALELVRAQTDNALAAQKRELARVEELKAENRELAERASQSRQEQASLNEQVVAARADLQRMEDSLRVKADAVAKATVAAKRAAAANVVAQAKASESKSRADAKMAAQAKAAAEAQLAAQTQAAADAKMAAQVKAASDAKVATLEKAVADAKAAAIARAADAKALADAKAASDAKIAALQKSAADAKATADAKVAALQKAAADARASADAKNAADGKAAADAKAAMLAKAATDAQRAANAKTLADARAVADAKALANAEAKAAANGKALADAKANAKALADAKAIADATLIEDKKALAEARSETKANVAAAKVATVALAKGETSSAKRMLAKVQDVRFDDDGQTGRVTLQLSGDAEYSVVKSDEKGAVLRVRGVTLPKKFERTLDASAYGGSVRSISTYADPDDASAMRVEVTVDRSRVGAEPKLVADRDAGKMVWEFPRKGMSTRPPQVIAAAAVDSPQSTHSTSVTMPNTTPKRTRRTYEGRRIDLDFKDADIHNILRLLSDVGQVNIITSDEVKGSVTIRMRDVPWDQALDVILRSKSLGMQREGNLIRVALQSTLEKEVEQEVARAKAAVELKPIETRLVPLSYADATQLMPRIQEVMSSRGHVSVDTRTNMLIVSDISSNIALAEDLVRNLDTQTPQVLIEARVVEATSNFLQQIGIQWGGSVIGSAETGNPTGLSFPSSVGVGGGASDSQPITGGLLGAAAANPNYVVNLPAPVGSGSGGALGLSLGSVNKNLNINLRLSALENTGNVRIVSAPKVTTLDNIEAVIEQGTSIPISVVSAAGTNTVFIDAKLNLTVKPHVTNEGSVIMNVSISRNEPDFVNTGPQGDPTILKKQAKTQLLVRDGDTAVIGGIYTRNTGMSYKKVPWLADIPILGWLFKNRTQNDDRTELIIFITPRIVNRNVVNR